MNSVLVVDFSRPALQQVKEERGIGEGRRNGKGEGRGGKRGDGMDHVYASGH